MVAVEASCYFDVFEDLVCVHALRFCYLFYSFWAESGFGVEPDGHAFDSSFFFW